MKRVLGLLSASLVLGACSDSGSSPPVSPSPAASVAAVLDCGTFELKQSEPMPDTAGRCFVEAVQAGQAARLKVTAPSVEGDPVPITYTAGIGGRVEVITDFRQDGFGTKQILRQVCTGPSRRTVTLDFAACTEPTPVPS